ncbi:MAG: O-antigen ligase family protein [Paludibacteraceae bacterium]|nr:O-antigen ligase family protein [Paludibacteraceae bacterium]
MKNLQKAYEYISYLLAISIAFPQKVSSCLLGIWSIFFLWVNFKSGYSFSFTKEKISNLLLLGISILGLVTITYAEDCSAVIQRTFEQRLTLILLPIFALFNKTSISFNKIIKFYILGNFLFITYSHFWIISDYIIGNNLEIQRNFALEASNIYNTLIHRSYSGLNILISYSGIFYLWNKNQISKKERIFLIIYIIYTLHYLIFNNSRGVSIALFATAIIAICIVIIKSKKKIITSLIVIVATILLILSFPNRTKDTISLITSEGIAALNEPRLQIWKACSSLLTENYLLGYGVNNIQKPLIEEYKKINFFEGVVGNFNSHNHFFEIWLEMGLIGPIALIVFLLSIPLSASKNKLYFTILFSTNYLISFLFESLLNRYFGCITLAFFMFFIYTKDKSNIKSETFLKKGWIMLILGVTALISIILLEYCSYNSKHLQSKQIVSSIITEHTEKNPFKFDFNKSRKFYFNDFAKGYYIIGISKIEESKTSNFEIECYVSEDFNGKEVLIYEETEKMEFIQSCEYDLNRKNEWQKLQIALKSNKKTSIICIQSYPINKIGEREGYIYLRNAKFTTK